jgi:hypothetical protein
VTTDFGPGAGTISVTGADPTGAADSSAAIQAALSAAGKLGGKGGSVYLPPGKYLIGATLAPVSGVRLYGDSRTAAKLFSTTVPVFNMGPAATLQAVEIDHLFLAATNADIFTGANIERSYIHDCELQQNSAGHSIWNSAPGPGLMVEVIFERNLESVHGSPRTVEAWFLVAPSNPNQVNQNTWRDEVCFNNESDPAQYWYHIQGNGAGTPKGDSNQFENVAFEMCPGGLIWLESCQDTLVENCHGWDFTGAYRGSLFKVSKHPNGIAPANNTFINCGSIQGTLADGASDFELDAHTSQTAIISPRASSHPLRIDCGNSTAVDLKGLPASVTLLNASGSAAPQFLGGTQASYRAAGVRADHAARTVTETSFTALTSSWPIPANDASQLGVRYKLRAWGTGTWGATRQDLRFQFVISAAMAAGSIAATALAAGASFAWQAECEIVMNAVGPAAGYTDTGSVRIFPTGSPAQAGQVVEYLGADAKVTMATTAAHQFSLQAEWGSATGAPAITCTGSTFERSGP